MDEARVKELREKLIANGRLIREIPKEEWPDNMTLYDPDTGDPFKVFKEDFLTIFELKDGLTIPLLTDNYKKLWLEAKSDGENQEIQETENA